MIYLFLYGWYRRCLRNTSYSFIVSSKSIMVCLSHLNIYSVINFYHSAPNPPFFVLLCNTGAGSCKLFSLSMDTMLGLARRGRQRDTARGGYFSWFGAFPSCFSGVAASKWLPCQWVASRGVLPTLDDGWFPREFYQHPSGQFPAQQVCGIFCLIQWSPTGLPLSLGWGALFQVCSFLGHSALAIEVVAAPCICDTCVVGSCLLL